MNVELTRFRVKEGKSELVDEWLKFLNDNMKDVLITLEDEKMYVETIFREMLDGNEYLYWCSVQGENGQEVEESENWIDKKHLQYWDECIDSNFRPVDLTTEVVMIPAKIREVMKQ
ncbi:hypothetical protein CIL05_01790 [Virgibacillus profundi]|uniref:Uncharacterized protein n=1 Tax=Virgibacillus profundi TaxID=2024555 RepID=A0A2A2IHD6_9BACI|nr:DUF6176 family protein [Virgibacillus profundi]PAV31411.1 hypothetical protein CIL05_01790 [Virgibacillus profundi]PXY55597.1 hypothetical protein CIT14_01800 [Virgibacillus profundi]